MQTKKRTHYNCYTSDGRKLLSKHEGMIPTGTGYYRRFSTTDLYIDGLIVRDGEPLLWQFDGGYVELDTNGTPTSWNYYITDHLGSTRKVVDSNNNVKETINYYPFGSEMRMSSPYQIIRKNGKMNLETAGIEKTGIDTGGFTFPADSAISIKDPGILMPKDSMAKSYDPLLVQDYWQPYRFTGKELDNQNGLNWYDFGARWFDVAGVPMWTSVDPLAEKYYNVSPYVYANNNPVRFIDPNGEDWTDCDGNILDNTEDIKVFIFYSADFADQAKVQYNDAIEQYGKGAVAMSLTSTEKEFATDWENMGGTDIQNVMIMTHGKNQSITLDEKGFEQLTSTANGKTNISKSEATNVQDLPTPKGNISNAVLNMYSCHSADKNPQKHGEGVHTQGELSGSKDPIAYAFAKKFNFRGVMGTAESVNYHSFFTDGTPKWSNNYLKPYPADGGRWTYIKRR